MQEKPRVGLILMRAEWLACEPAQGVRDSIQADTRAMLDRLTPIFEIQGPWVVDSVDTLHTCQRALRDLDLDMILLAFQTWAEDTLLVSLLQAIGTRPLVLWCYVPWRRLPLPASHQEVLRGTGPVGTFGAFGTLRNLGVPFFFTFGAVEDPRLIRDLVVAGRAARVRQALRTARFGLVPSRTTREQSTFVDEFRLMTDLGPVVQYIPVNEYKRVTDNLPRERVTAFLEQLAARFPVTGVSQETLERSAQAALGLAALASEHHLSLVALNDASVDLQRTFGFRPVLYPYAKDAQSDSKPKDLAFHLPEDVLYQPEGDLGAATANYILHCLTNSPTMFLEFWSWDEARNQFIAVHSGMENPALADPAQVWIGRSYDICQSGDAQGAQFQMIARPGRVTFFQLRSTPKGWQAIAASGVCLEGRAEVEGFPHAIVRMDTPIEHFLNRLAEVGATQHWVMAYGSVMHELEALCEMEKIPLERLTY